MIARKLAIAWAVAALLVLALAGTASAHADLVSSDPKAGSLIPVAPEKITLVFSEELNADGNTIVVTDGSGARVDNDDAALDLNDASRATVVATLKSGLVDGAYTVEWTNSSADGHSEEGSFSFTVGRAATPAAPAPLPATGAGDRAPLAALLLGALLLIGAGLGLRPRA